MQAATTGLPSWQAGSIAEIYREQGSYIHCRLRRSSARCNVFLHGDWPDPRPIWENLFPAAYWDELKKDSTQNRLDPILWRH